MGDSTQFLPRALTLAEPPSVSSLALPASLGLRGMVVVADKTAELYKTTYWASYNIPYVPFRVVPSPPRSVHSEAGFSPGDILNMLSKESSRSPAGKAPHHIVTSRSGTCCRAVWGGHPLGLGIARRSAGSARLLGGGAAHAVPGLKLKSGWVASVP